MTGISDDTAEVAQREVQRLLGRCMLRLQQYERLIKHLAAHSEVSGTVNTFRANHDERVNATTRKTLGMLVGEMLGGYVVGSEGGSDDDKEPHLPEGETGFHMRFGVELSNADFTRIEKELREMVLMRNDLVHRFIEQHDIGSLEGCRRALVALKAAYAQVDQNFENLKDWAADVERLRAKMRKALGAQEF